MGGLAERDIQELRERLAESGRIAAAMTLEATQALLDWSAESFDSTVASGRTVEELHTAIDHDVESFIAAHEATGDQLRVALTILHINRSVERAAHNAVRVAYLATPPPHRVPAEEAVIADSLRAMGERGAEMLRTALDALDRRDVDAVRLLQRLDEVIDRENEKLAETVLGIGTAEYEVRQWATRMLFAGRWLERIGDHAVNIAERVSAMGPQPGGSVNRAGR